MNNIHKRIFCIFTTLTVLLFGQTLIAPTVVAISKDSFIDKFAANDIIFYHPDECSDGNHTISGSCGGEITGTTEEERLRQVIEGYGVIAMNLQIEYGTPWELAFGQMIMESSVGDSDTGVNAGVEAKGYYNWLGLSYGGSHWYNLAEAYDSGSRKWSMYESIGDMLAGYMVDFMRNGYYSSAYQYTDPNNFDLEKFFFAEIESYCPQSECMDHKVYWSVVQRGIKVANEVAQEKGWPTSEELAKEQNIPIGGKYPDINTDIHKQVDIEAHSLHVSCTGGTFEGGSSANATYTGDGSDVTWIGDSISYLNQSTIKNALPNVDLHAKSSKKWEEDLTDNESGLTILKSLYDDNKVRKYLVFALGSNNGDVIGGLNESHINQLLEYGKNAEKIVILTNYHPVYANAYSINNALFEQSATKNPKLILADWKTAASKAPSTYMGNNGTDVHPTEEGAKVFVDLVIQALGIGVKTTNSAMKCDCDEGSLTSINGGLSQDQADKLLAYFMDSNNDSKWTPSLKKWNCTSMSTFFTQMFTSINGTAAANGGAKKDCIACSDGHKVVNSLSALGVPTGSEPKPFSIFSVNNASSMTSSSAGHTGVVLNIEGDTVTTIEAFWGLDNVAKVKTHSLSEFVNTVYPDKVFAYLDDYLDDKALSNAIGSDVTVASGSGVASSSITWSDGWITGGMDGYVKEPGASVSLDSAHNGNFKTTSPKTGSTGPNKILLHNTEGQNGSGTSGLEIYYGNTYPAHFTIDLKNKKVYQHFPINKPSDAIASHDDTAGVQIEIIGFSSSGYKNNSWYLLDSNNFGDDEWNYLAKLLAGISAETGIPLTTSVDWENPTRLSVNDFKNYEGILGHMHAPDNDHVDPNNIWPMLLRALGNVKGSGNCDNNSYTGDFPWYGQCNAEWSDEPYGSCGTVCSNGCGVASYAMMATALTRTVIKPDEVAKYAGDLGLHVCGEGSSHSLPLKISDHYGLVAEDLEASGTVTVDRINEYLRKGWMIWTCGGGPAPFSENGHCIGIRGITNDGRWLLADSGSNGEKHTLEMDWDPGDVYPYMNNYKAIKAK